MTATDAKIDVVIKTALDKIKECKDLDFTNCEESFWPDLEIGLADGSTTHMNLYQMAWASGIKVNLFADGKVQIDAVYQRAISVAIRKETFEADKIDDAIKMLISIFADTSKPKTTVLVPLNGDICVLDDRDD